MKQYFVLMRINFVNGKDNYHNYKNIYYIVIYIKTGVNYTYFSNYIQISFFNLVPDYIKNMDAKNKSKEMTFEQQLLVINFYIIKYNIIIILNKIG